MLRVAAVGVLHVGVDSVGQLRGGFAHLAEQADVLLLAGDLTKRGELAEADVLADEVRGLPVPIVAVLGNHDYESDQERVLTQRLLDVGVRILEGSATVLEIDEVRLGIAGGKGFAGGFAGACATAFGEREMKLFANASLLAASAMESALTSLDADVRVLLTHYAPIQGDPAWRGPRALPDARQLPVRRARGPVRGRPARSTDMRTPGPRRGPRRAASPSATWRSRCCARPYAVYGVEQPGRHAARARGRSAGRGARRVSRTASPQRSPRRREISEFRNAGPEGLRPVRGRGRRGSAARRWRR